MKPSTRRLILNLLTLLLIGGAYANPDPAPAARSTAATAAKANLNAGAVRFQFRNAHTSDSVLVIFDRYDRTGAGVVYQVYATDSTNGITIPEIPAGKYYVTIQCKGVNRDRIEKLVTIKAKKHEKVRVELEAAEVFSKDGVVIPAFNPSFSDLAILRSK
jgi:hypothetical protein